MTNKNVGGILESDLFITRQHSNHQEICEEPHNGNGDEGLRDSNLQGPSIFFIPGEEDTTK